MDRGTTRLRRYVVERPVEEQIRLRNETVSVHRRAVTAGDRVSPDAFTDKTIEVRETAEEAVVGKTARVVEEVVVQKGVDERVETVRDTVRREQVEISGAGSLSGAGSVPAARIEGLAEWRRADVRRCAHIHAPRLLRTVGPCPRLFHSDQILMNPNGPTIPTTSAPLSCNIFAAISASDRVSWGLNSAKSTRPLPRRATYRT